MAGHLANLGFLSLLLLTLEFGHIDLAMSCSSIDMSSNTKQEILHYHNSIRQREWADLCSGEYQDREDRKISSRDYRVGQQIYQTFTPEEEESWDRVFESWYEDVDKVTNGEVDNYQNLNQIGFYAQIVWAETYELGCRASREPCTYEGQSYPHCQMYVCNYGPTGRIRTTPIYKQGTPASFLCDFGGSTKYPGLCKATLR